MLSNPFLHPGEKKVTSTAFTGPFKVIECIGPTNYIIDKHGVMDNVHVDRIKKYRPMDGTGPRERYREHARRSLEEELREQEIWSQADEETQYNLRSKALGDNDKIKEEDEEEDENKSEQGSESEDDESNEEEDRFEVEAILDKRIIKKEGRLGRGKEVQYLIKWKGYPDSENTWEKQSNLDQCQQLVDEYEQMAAAMGETHPMQTSTTPQ